MDLPTLNKTTSDEDLRLCAIKATRGKKRSHLNVLLQVEEDMMEKHRRLLDAFGASLKDPEAQFDKCDCGKDKSVGSQFCKPCIQSFRN
tara:strand:- start:169 stop:435 length:267 start_codon:yes stop_codon:yes gene_type:complete